MEGEDFLLDIALGKSFIDQFEMDVACLLVLPPDLVLVYLPMLLAHLDEAAAAEEDPKMIEVACEFVKTCLCRYRPTKLRFIMLCQLGKHRKLWSLKLEKRSDAYSRNERHLSAIDRKLHKVSAESAIKSESRLESATMNVTPASLLDSTEALEKWVRDIFLHPEKGIERENHTVGLRKVPESFSEQDAVLFVVNTLEASGIMARKICTRMVELGLIIKVTFFPVADEFGLGKNYYRSKKELSSDSDTFSVSCKKNSSRPRDKNFNLADNNIESVQIQTTVYVDQMDLISLSFWKSLIWMKPLEQDKDFGMIQVIHPLKAITSTHLEDIDAVTPLVAVLESVDHAGVAGNRVYVNKVFTSVARPGIVSVEVAPEKSAIEIEEEDFFCKEFKSLDPKLLVKEGDNLMQDMNVEILFRVFNYIWRKDNQTFPDPNNVPFSYVYDVMPTGLVKGVMEVLTKVSPLNHYKWDDWAKEYGQKPEVQDLMLRSAAGSYVAAYVLGAGDRHWDNVMIKGHAMLLHIDFGFVMGDKAPIEGPRFPVSPDMEKAFTDVGIWEDFIDLCGKAFTSLKHSGPLIGREIYAHFRHTGLTHKECMGYLASKESLNVKAKSEKEAEDHVKDQVRTAPRNWKTFMRSYAHDHIDPFYYEMLEKKFPPALLADALVQRKQEKKNLKATGQEEHKGMRKFREDVEAVLHLGKK